MKREDQLRNNALDFAIRCQRSSVEDISTTTARAAAFFSFLRGTNSPRPKKAKR